MGRTAIDSETHLIKPGLLAPKLVCVTWATRDGEGQLLDGLLLADDGLRFVRKLLKDPSEHLIGANMPYDLGVFCAEDPTLLPLVFDAYDQGRIHCVQTREKLIAIFEGRLKWEDPESDDYDEDDPPKQKRASFSLQSLVARYLKEFLAKEDTFRLRYNELDGVPLAEWPAEAISYAKSDAVNTLRVFEEQEVFCEGDPLPDEAPQSQAAFALHLLSMWGMRTDADAVAELRETLEAEVAVARLPLLAAGIYKPRGDKTVRSMERVRTLVVETWKRQRALCEAAGLEVPPLERTAKGAECDACAQAQDTAYVCPKHVKTSRTVLYATEHPDLKILADVGFSAKQLENYVPKLEKAAIAPLCARYDLAETGRTTCTDGIQNPPRKGRVRECFVPPPGYVFLSVDYDTIELRAHAQNCLEFVKHSALADVLQSGKDPHLITAAKLLGDITYDEIALRYAALDPVVDEHRQLSKPANFGFPGGMRERAFVAFALSQGIKITFEQAVWLRESWLSAYPENEDYFAFVKGLLDPVTKEALITHPVSGRLRGRVPYTSAANGFFQARVADGAKRAHWEVAKRCYAERAAKLYGSRPAAFLHDEIITCVPDHPERMHEAAEEQTQVMIGVMQKVIPDIPIKASPVLMRRWYKGAKAKRIGGRLVPVRPVYARDPKGKVIVSEWVPDETGDLVPIPAQEALAA